jgi:hypothetical protein
MPCFPPAVQEVFKRWGECEVLDSLEASYQELIDRRKDIVEYGSPETISPRQRASANCRLFHQSLLHRAERLIVSSGSMLLEGNVYGMALLARGHYETTAMLGYLCHRLESLAGGNISFEDFEWNIADAVMSSKHKQFSAAPAPVNIMTCIEKADRYLDKHFFKAKKRMIQDNYDWLSEFAHPNFLSNVSAFSLDKEQNRIVLRHGSDLRKEDLHLLGYLDISNGLFIVLFDAFAERLKESGLDQSRES